MKLHPILAACLMVAAAPAFAQQEVSSEPPAPVAAANLQLLDQPQSALSEEEQELVWRLEQIESDPAARAQAAAEAQVPLNVF